MIGILSLVFCLFPFLCACYCIHLFSKGDFVWASGLAAVAQITGNEAIFQLTLIMGVLKLFLENIRKGMLTLLVFYVDVGCSLSCIFSAFHTTKKIIRIVVGKCAKGIRVDLHDKVFADLFERRLMAIYCIVLWASYYISCAYYPSTDKLFFGDYILWWILVFVEFSSCMFSRKFSFSDIASCYHVICTPRVCMNFVRGFIWYLKHDLATRFTAYFHQALPILHHVMVFLLIKRCARKILECFSVFFSKGCIFWKSYFVHGLMFLCMLKCVRDIESNYTLEKFQVGDFCPTFRGLVVLSQPKCGDKPCFVSNKSELIAEWGEIFLKTDYMDYYVSFISNWNSLKRWIMSIKLRFRSEISGEDNLFDPFFLNAAYSEKVCFITRWRAVFQLTVVMVYAVYCAFYAPSKMLPFTLFVAFYVLLGYPYERYYVLG